MIDLAPDIIVLLFFIAMIAGFLDSVSGGGGLVALPALLAAGINPLSALATNKFQACIGMVAAVWNFWRAGQVDFKLMAWPLLAVFVGASLGGYALTIVDTRYLMIVLPLLLIAMAFYFLLRPAMSDVDRHARLGQVAYSGVAGCIGFYDGFFGPGAGSFFVLSLVTLMGMGLLRATGNTKALNWVSITTSLLILIAGGHMIWMLGGIMAVGNFIGGQIGSRSAIRWGTKIIRPLLVVISLVMTVKLLLNPDNPLRQLVQSWF